MALSTTGLMINPTDDDIYSIQTYAYQTTDENANIMQTFNGLFNSMAGESPELNRPRYISGFKIRYSYIDTIETGKLPEDEYPEDNIYQYFIIEGGTAIIDKQIITFNEKHLQVRVSNNLEDDDPNKLLELDANQEYVITVKYIRNQATFDSIPAQINIIQLSEFQQESMYSYLLKIGSFKTDDQKNIYSLKEKITQYDYSNLLETKKDDYILIEGMYYLRNIDDQNLKQLQMDNFKPFFDNMTNELVSILSSNNLSNISFEELSSNDIIKNVPSGTFLTFDDTVGKYNEVSSINDQIIGIFLKYKESIDGIIVYSGILDLDPEMYEIPYSLNSLIPGNIYYLDSSQGNITVQSNNNFKKIGYALSHNKILLRFEAFETSKEAKDLDIFLTLFGTKEDVEVLLNNYFDKQKDELDLINYRNLSSIITQEINLFEQILNQKEEEIKDEDITDLFTSLSTSIDLNKIVELYLTLILSYLQKGISNPLELSGYFNSAKDLDFETKTRITTLINEINISTPSKSLQKLNKNSTVKIAMGGNFENLIYNNENDNDSNIEAILYVNPANEGELILIKIITDNPSNYDLIFDINDSNGYVGSLTVFAGKQEGILQIATRKDDVYIGTNSYEFYISKVLGTDKDKVIWNSDKQVVSIPDTITKTTLSFSKELSNFKELELIRVNIESVIEGESVKGYINYIGSEGNILPFPTNIDVSINCIKGLDQQELILNIQEAEESKEFQFDISTNDDEYQTNESVEIKINSVSGNDFKYKKDSSSVVIPIQNDLTKTILKMSIDSEDDLNDTITYNLKLSNIPKSPFKAVFSTGEELILLDEDLNTEDDNDIYPISKKITLNSLPDGYLRNIDKVNTTGGDFESLVFDVSGMGIENDITLRVNDTKEGLKTTFIVQCSEYLIDPISFQVFDLDDNFVCDVVIPANANIGITEIIQSENTNIIDGINNSVYLKDQEIDDDYYNYNIDQSYVSYQIRDNIDNVYWSYYLSEGKLTISLSESAQKGIQSEDANEEDLITVFSLRLRDQNTGLMVNSENIIIPYGETIITQDINIIYSENDIEVTNSITPFESFIQVDDITNLPSNASENNDPLEDANSKIYNMDILKWINKYKYTYTIELSNPPQSLLSIELQDQFGNLVNKELNEKKLQFDEIRENIQMLPDYKLNNTSGGNFEFLEVIGLPQVLIYSGADLTLSSNGTLFEDYSILYTCTLTKALVEDLWIQLNNGEELIIPAGKLSCTIESKNISTSQKFSNDDYNNSQVILNYIKSVNKSYVKVINGYSNPISTMVVDDKTSVKLKVSSHEINGNIKYSAEVSSYPQSDVTIILENNTLITIPKNQRFGETVVSLEELKLNIDIPEIIYILLQSKTGKLRLYEQLKLNFKTMYKYIEPQSSTINDSNILGLIQENIDFIENEYYTNWENDTLEYPPSFDYDQKVLEIENYTNTYQTQLSDTKIILQLFDYFESFIIPKLNETIDDYKIYINKLRDKLQIVQTKIQNIVDNKSRYIDIALDKYSYSIDLYKITDYQRKLYNFNYLHLNIQTKYSEIDKLLEEKYSVQKSKDFNLNSNNYLSHVDKYYSQKLEQIQYDITSRKYIIIKYLGEFNIYREELGLLPAVYGKKYETGSYLQNTLEFYK